MWDIRIFNTTTGSPEMSVPVSDCSWARRLTGRGQGQHTIPLFGSGIPQSLARELSWGNKYTIAQMWGDHVAYAGVIQRRTYKKDSQSLVIDSSELRAAYMNARMLYPIQGYDPLGYVLVIEDKNHSGAARAVVDMATNISAFWHLPIDLPADGSGSFTVFWEKNRRLKWEDHLSQIEQDGCEIDFHPYLDGDGYLRWETRVDTKISDGPVTDLHLNAPNSPVVGLEVVDDYSRVVTGQLAFGEGGKGAATRYTPFGFVPPDIEPISIRDTVVNFPDIDEDRLQAASDAHYDTIRLPTNQWSFGLDIHPDGPAYAAPGSTLNLWVYGDPFIPDGESSKRVVALRGDMGFTVTPEVQSA